MFKLWAKILDEDRRIIKDINKPFEENFNPSILNEYIYAVCYDLDIPSPIVIKKHIDNFVEFNHVKFSESDFIEKIDFVCLIIENGGE